MTAGRDGGTGLNTLVADADADWRLSDTALIAGSGRIDLVHVTDASLFGGAAANRIDVSGWTGSINVDGREGSDEVTIDAGIAASGMIRITDTGTGVGDVDQLTLLGTDNADTMSSDN